MQLATDSADELCEPPFVRSVNILVAGLDLELQADSQHVSL